MAGTATKPRQVRVTLYVPETRNDGTAVELTFLSVLEEEILKVATGFTLSPAIGAWSSEDETYRDALRLYAVDVPATSTVIDDLARLGQSIKDELGQEAIYITVTPIETLEVPVPA